MLSKLFARPSKKPTPACLSVLISFALATGVGLAPLSGAAQPQTHDPVPPRLGNLPAGFYPAPPCKKPVPEKNAEGPRGMADAQFAMIGDNNRARNAERYNKAAAAYDECAKTYIQQSEADVERIVSLVNSAITGAQEASPTKVGNLPADLYPRSSCVKPGQLDASPANGDLAAITAYNLKVATFNQQVAAYNACMPDYRDRAWHDIEEIRATVRAPTLAGTTPKP